MLVTRPFYESRLNWVADPAPPASRCLDEMTSPTPAPAIPTPPAEVHPRLPGRLQSRRRRRRKAAASANRNSASRQADLATPPYSYSCSYGLFAALLSRTLSLLWRTFLKLCFAYFYTLYCSFIIFWFIS